MNSFLILSIEKVMVIIALKYNDQTATVDLHAIDWSWVIAAPLTKHALAGFPESQVLLNSEVCYLLSVPPFELLNSACPVPVGM